MMNSPGTGYAEAPDWSALHGQASRGDRLALQVLLCLAERQRTEGGAEPPWLAARGPNGRTLQHAAAQFGWMAELVELEGRVGPTPDLEDGVRAARHFLDPDRPVNAGQALGPADFHREAGGGLRFALRNQLAAAEESGPARDALRSVSAGNAGVPSGRTAMHHAMRFGWYEEARSLHDAHAQTLDAPDSQGVQPWQLAVANGHGDLLGALRSERPEALANGPDEEVVRAAINALSPQRLLEAIGPAGRSPETLALPDVEARARWLHDPVGVPRPVLSQAPPAQAAVQDAARSAVARGGLLARGGRVAHLVRSPPPVPVPGHGAPATTLRAVLSGAGPVSVVSADLGRLGAPSASPKAASPGEHGGVSL